MTVNIDGDFRQGDAPVWGSSPKSTYTITTIALGLIISMVLPDTTRKTAFFAALILGIACLEQVFAADECPARAVIVVKYPQSLTRTCHNDQCLLQGNKMGITFHGGQFLGEDEFDMITDIFSHGILRIEYFWYLYETYNELHTYKWYVSDDYIAKMNARNITAMGILYGGQINYGTTNAAGGLDWMAPPKTPQAIEGFTAFAAAAAEHNKGKNIFFEIWNEPNLPTFWGGAGPNPQEFTNLAAATAAAMRAADPNVTIAGAGLSEMPFDFIDQMMKLNIHENWDSLTIHPYRSGAPESALQDLARVRRMIKGYTPLGKEPITLAVSEWGYSTKWWWAPLNNEQQAYFGTVREFLTCVMSDSPQCLLYDWKDDEIDGVAGTGDNAEENFGMVYNTYTAGAQPYPYQVKPAFVAAKTYASILGTADFNQRIWFYDDLKRQVGTETAFLVLFSKWDSLEPVFVAWSSSETDSAVVPIRLGDDQTVTVTSTYGDKSTMTAVNGWLNITVNKYPQYVEASLTSDYLKVLTAIRRLPTDTHFSGEEFDLKTVLVNPLEAPFTATVEDGEQQVVLPGQGAVLKKHIAAGSTRSPTTLSNSTSTPSETLC
eukprot:TRINITY_DN1873_c0_g1_i2.p1 TRINITY_DN1873_c0_g1~~TRINITY_DN1873_c0_g1_i2.p1  ORF type:complete len:603 (+),score=161.71 TRINITY_DN1873_c0_g1_i2:1895-3703(+)